MHFNLKLTDDGRYVIVRDGVEIRDLGRVPPRAAVDELMEAVISVRNKESHVGQRTANYDIAPDTPPEVFVRIDDLGLTQQVGGFPRGHAFVSIGGPVKSMEHLRSRIDAGLNPVLVDPKSTSPPPDTSMIPGMNPAAAAVLDQLHGVNLTPSEAEQIILMIRGRVRKCNGDEYIITSPTKEYSRPRDDGLIFDPPFPKIGGGRRVRIIITSWRASLLLASAVAASSCRKRSPKVRLPKPIKRQLQMDCLISIGSRESNPRPPSSSPRSPAPPQRSCRCSCPAGRPSSAPSGRSLLPPFSSRLRTSPRLPGRRYRRGGAGVGFSLPAPPR